MTLETGALWTTVFFGTGLAVAGALAWRGRFWAPVLVAAALCLAVRLPQAPVPIFNIDEAINAAIAMRLREGQVLYGGVWDHKPPLSFYLYRTIFDLFGAWNMTAVHLVAGFLHAGVVVMTGLVARRLLPRAAAPWPAVLLAPYGLLYFRYDFMAMNHELGGVPFLLLCVLCLWRGLALPPGPAPGPAAWYLRHRRGTWLVAAGIAGATGGLFREACAMILPVSGLFLLVRPWLAPLPPSGTAPAPIPAPTRREAITDAACLVAGALVPSGIFVGWLFAHGVERDAAYLMITHNLRYRAAGRHGIDWLAHAISSVRSFVLYAPALWTTIVLGTVVVIVRGARALRRRTPIDPRLVFLGAWCLGAGYMVGQGGRFHGHYFVPFYPPLMIAAAGWLASLRWPARPARETAAKVAPPAQGRQRKTRDVAAPVPPAAGPPAARGFALGPYALCAVLGLSLFPFHHFHASEYAVCVRRFVFGQEVRTRIADIMIGRDHLAASKLMAAMSTEKEPVFVWGFAPQLYVLAQRRPATRFTFTALLSGQTVEGRFIKTDPRLWDLLKADLEKERPALVLDASSLFLKDQPLEKYPEFRAWLMERYRPVIEVQGCRFYERNDRKPTELVP